MCILCVVQRWSRRVATMLPWLVLSLILLWAFSHLLPPGYRFEVTSPRLACVLVLLLTLMWYEIVLPRLSVWRARRSARLRERRRIQALEMQKLRKTATRRCRNCHAPYRDQNPGGGRFMCSSCGHISKRPVLDLPGPASPVAKNGWVCNQEWPAEGGGNWVGSAPGYWLEENCLTAKSYPTVFMLPCTLLSRFFLGMKWLCRKVFLFGLSREGGSLDVDQKTLLKRGDDGENLHESRGEKARRKAEEKRQARLEKEMLEEEERKQREEVARMVEERRRLRDEKLEAEERSKGATPVGERESRKEAERRRQERRKDKDKGSNKSNSDCEDPEKRACSENERKREFDRKNENERRDPQRASTENYKLHAMDVSLGNKMATNKPKYLNRMASNFPFTSRTFTGASFFGKSAQSSTYSVNKDSKMVIGVTDHSYAIKKDAHSTAHSTAKATSLGDDRNCWTSRPVSPVIQPQTTTPKKSWHQLFTRSAAISPDPDMSVSIYQKQNGYLGAHNTNLFNQKLVPQYSANNQLTLGKPIPFPVYSQANSPFTSSSLTHFATGPMFPAVQEPGPAILEESEHFEDPCYDPDAIALLGPVSESLDNFPLDIGSGFVSSGMPEGPVLNSVSASGEVNRPSPIESPLSRSRVSEEKNTKCGPISCSSKQQGSHASNLQDSSHQQGTWQMWGSPLPQDGLRFVTGHSSWLLPIGQIKDNQADVYPGIQSPHHVHGVKQQNDGTYSSLVPGLNDNGLWVQQAPFQVLPTGAESHLLPLNLAENILGQETSCKSPNQSSVTHPFEPSLSNCWSKKDWVGDSQEVGSSMPAGLHTGGSLSTNSDVQPVWSFNQKEIA